MPETTVTLEVARELVERGRGYCSWENALARALLAEHEARVKAEELDEVVQSALQEIMGMEWGERKETPFQFEQRIHAVAHGAWLTIHRHRGSPPEAPDA